LAQVNNLLASNMIGLGTYGRLEGDVAWVTVQEIFRQLAA
jgi:hypothetical protein